MPSIYKNSQKYAGFSLDLSQLTFNSLTTVNKGLVTAINELDAKIGNSTLITQSSTITSAINELKNSITNLSYSDISGTVTETDPVFSASAAYNITTTDINSWKNANSLQWNNTSKQLRVSKNSSMVTVFSRTDLDIPEVYDWAKAATKPSYNFTEIQGTVPSSALPSYVDDVLEYSSVNNFPATGESDKIYIDTSTNLTYRWGGTTYAQISSSLALGTTSSTAYRGDYGDAAYQHAVTNKGSAFTNGLYKITTNNEGHIIAAIEVVKADITALGIPAQDTTYESLSSASGGADESLVTTGEKYNWNNKLSLTGGAVTGPVNFTDSVSLLDATVGDLLVTGQASFANSAVVATNTNYTNIQLRNIFFSTTVPASTTGNNGDICIVYA